MDWFEAHQTLTPAEAKGRVDPDRIALAGDFLRCYSAARQGLRTLGVMRSDRTVQSDYAEWLMARMFDLTLAPSAVQRGYDATDAQGRTYQIKARIVRVLTDRTSFDFRRAASGFDYLLGVFLAPDYEVLGVIGVPRLVVRELGTPNRSSFRLRWNAQVAADVRVMRLIWPTQTEETANGAG